MHERRSPLGSVSRETIDKLRGLESLALEWNSKINLVSKNTETDFWNRHIVDSAQLFNLANDQNSWCDLGSGGGFPGLVIGVLQSERCENPRLTLVESDKRKCAFLQTAMQKLDIAGTVVAKRIEAADICSVSTLSARALAPLERLLDFAGRFVDETSEALFSKGRKWKNEVIVAEDKWRFDLDVVQSVTDPEAVILRVSGIERRS